MLYIDTTGDQRQVDGDIFQAEKMASDYFDSHPESCRILEILSPLNKYTATVYAMRRDANLRRREVLIFRVSTEGFNPVFKPTLQPAAPAP